MKIVLLEAETLGSDIDFSGFEQFGEFIVYQSSTEEEAALRIKDADIVLVNKILMNEETLRYAGKVKLICNTATGINNLDIDYLEKRGILWKNVAGYSTESVTQHTFAILFYLLEKLRYYDDFVKNGRYMKSNSFTHLDVPFTELKDKVWGIIGLGTIGRRVADVASAFGLRVIYASASNRPPQEGYQQVSLDELYERSDIISVHAPLNEYTENLIDWEAFKKMKDTCIFLNLGRGPIVVEKDLRRALDENQIEAAGLDVLCHEPMREDCPLWGFEDSSRLLITPHIAWATREARQRLIDIVLGYVKDYVSCV